MKLLLYFSDAFAWQYCQEIDYMADFWLQRRPLKTLLGYSSTIMPSLLSGKPPRETGIWTEYYFHPRKQSPLAAALASTPLSCRLANMARLVAFRFARRAGWQTAHRLRIPLQFAHLFERHPIDYQRFPPIDLPFPQLDSVFREAGLRVDSRFLHGSPDVEEETAYLRQKMVDADVFFYHDHMADAAGHRAGASTEAVKPAIEATDAFLRRAWEMLGGEGSCEMLLFSDHGMTTVERTYDIYGALAEFQIGKDYLLFSDSTFARLWFLEQTKRLPIEAALGDAPGHFLTDDELRRFGIDFEDNRYGDAVLMADEGVIFHPNYISPRFFRTRGYPDRGMHGYSPDAPSSYGMVAYRGTRWQQPFPGELQVIDLFPLVAGIVQLSAAAPARLGA